MEKPWLGFFKLPSTIATTCTGMIGRICSTMCRLLCVPDSFDHVCSTMCRLLRVSDGNGHMCSTMCRLLCEPNIID
ncbi:hypothetical protein V6Z12_D09G047400 [Gossypium hirsutum]